MQSSLQNQRDLSEVNTGSFEDQVAALLDPASGCDLMQVLQCVHSKQDLSYYFPGRDELYRAEVIARSAQVLLQVLKDEWRRILSLYPQMVGAIAETYKIDLADIAELLVAEDPEIARRFCGVMLRRDTPSSESLVRFFAEESVESLVSLAATDVTSAMAVARRTGLTAQFTTKAIHSFIESAHRDPSVLHDDQFWMSLFEQQPGACLEAFLAIPCEKVHTLLKQVGHSYRIKGGDAAFVPPTLTFITMLLEHPTLTFAATSLATSMNMLNPVVAVFGEERFIKQLAEQISTYARVISEGDSGALYTVALRYQEALQHAFKFISEASSDHYYIYKVWASVLEADARLVSIYNDLVSCAPLIQGDVIHRPALYFITDFLMQFQLRTALGAIADFSESHSNAPVAPTYPLPIDHIGKQLEQLPPECAWVVANKLSPSHAVSVYEYIRQLQDGAEFSRAQRLRKIIGVMQRSDVREVDKQTRPAGSSPDLHAALAVFDKLQGAEQRRAAL
jgi:hypothetical protein